MKKMIINAIILTLAVALCICAVACGKNENNGQSTTEKPQSNPSTPENSKPSQSNPSGTNPDDEPEQPKRAAFLLIGQSNAAGRGAIEYTYPIENENCFMYVGDSKRYDLIFDPDKSWKPMSEPMNIDKGESMAGACLATSFLDAYQKTFGGEVGVIPCAMGGSKIEEWAVDGELYNNAWNSAMAAMEDGTEIVGILWHQGEANASDSKYADKLDTIMYNLLSDLELPEDTPIIVGEIGRWYGNTEVNKQLNAYADDFDNAACASSEGLLEDKDIAYGGHFDGASLRILGLRYFAEYHKLVTGKEWTFDDTYEDWLNK